MGLATLVGWVIFLVTSASASSWITAVFGTLVALALNCAALFGLREIEAVKMHHQFAANKQLLAEIGNKLLANSISLEEAKALTAAYNIDFTPKIVNRTSGCFYIFFHAFGALDSQLGYYYVPVIKREHVCGEIECATKIEQTWCYGVL